MATFEERVASDPDFANIVGEYEDIFGQPPPAGARVSALRAQIRAQQQAERDALPTIMGGGETIRRRFGAGGVEDDIWYQIYEFPPGSGQFVAYEFNDAQQLQAVLGRNPDVRSVTENQFQEMVIAQAPVEEIVGVNQTFDFTVDQIMRDAAIKAGINDPALAGRIASDPEIQQIMAQATIGDWTPQQIAAAQRDTSFWKNELYPGIERFYGTTSNPEQAWRSYVTQVTPALRQLGYSEDSDGSFNSQIKRMLDGNIDSQTFLSQVPTFILATQNQEFGAILNEWTNRDLGVSVGFQDWFDMLEGNAAPEIEQVAENARLEWIAQNQGASVSTNTIAALAGRTELSDAEAITAFGDLNRAVLALGEEGLARGGLTRDEVLSAAAGVAPNSGRSVAEVQQQVAKLARENDLFDEQQLDFFVGFDPLGRPERPGLASIAPEGA